MRNDKRFIGRVTRELGGETHEYIPEMADQLAKGLVDRREFVRTAALLGMSATAAYTLAGKITGEHFVPQAAAQGKQGGKIRIAMPVQEMTDPATFSWVEKSNVARFLVEHLTLTGTDNITRPYLADRWEASDDLKSWTFYLRKGVTWNNGDDFNADDVVHTVNRWLDPATGSSNLGLFAPMVEEVDTGKKDDDGNAIMEKRGIPGAVEKVDSHTVRFNLRQAALAMPENFYNYPTAITHRGFGKDYEADLSKNPIGTHAFELSEFRIGEQAVLKKTRDWWKGDFYLDEIQYIDLGEDLNAAVGAIASDQVDMIYQINTDQLDIIDRLPNVQVHEAITAQTGVMRMRVDTKPFDDQRVRDAIRLCLDRQAAMDIAYRGRGLVAEDHHVCQIHPEYFELPMIQRDIARAKELLAEAGYADGLTLDIDVGDTNGPWETAQCEAFKSQLEPAGITLNINKMPANQYWEVWDTTPFGLTVWTHRPLGTMVLSLGYRSGVPWNETGYSNPEFDKALDEAESLLDVNERKKKMEKVEKILQDDAVMAQPFWRSVFKAANKRVKNFNIHPTLYHQLDQVWIDDNA